MDYIIPVNQTRQSKLFNDSLDYFGMSTQTMEDLNYNYTPVKCRHNACNYNSSGEAGYCGIHINESNISDLLEESRIVQYRNTVKSRKRLKLIRDTLYHRFIVEMSSSEQTLFENTIHMLINTGIYDFKSDNISELFPQDSSRLERIRAGYSITNPNQYERNIRRVFSRRSKMSRDRLINIILNNRILNEELFANNDDRQIKLLWENITNNRWRSTPDAADDFNIDTNLKTEIRIAWMSYINSYADKLDKDINHSSASEMEELTTTPVSGHPSTGGAYALFFRGIFHRIHPNGNYYNPDRRLPEINRVLDIKPILSTGCKDPELHECPVCYDNKKLCKLPKCTHNICEECWLKWAITSYKITKTYTCPLCRETQI